MNNDNPPEDPSLPDDENHENRTVNPPNPPNLQIWSAEAERMIASVSDGRTVPNPVNSVPTIPRPVNFFPSIPTTFFPTVPASVNPPPPQAGQHNAAQQSAISSVARAPAPNIHQPWVSAYINSIPTQDGQHNPTQSLLSNSLAVPTAQGPSQPGIPAFVNPLSTLIVPPNPDNPDQPVIPDNHSRTQRLDPAQAARNRRREELRRLTRAMREEAPPREEVPEDLPPGLLDRLTLIAARFDAAARESTQLERAAAIAEAEERRQRTISAGPIATWGMDPNHPRRRIQPEAQQTLSPMSRDVPQDTPSYPNGRVNPNFANMVPNNFENQTPRLNDSPARPINDPNDDRSAFLLRDNFVSETPAEEEDAETLTGVFGREISDNAMSISRRRRQYFFGDSDSSNPASHAASPGSPPNTLGAGMDTTPNSPPIPAPPISSPTRGPRGGPSQNTLTASTNSPRVSPATPQAPVKRKRGQDFGESPDNGPNKRTCHIRRSSAPVKSPGSLLSSPGGSGDPVTPKTPKTPKTSKSPRGPPTPYPRNWDSASTSDLLLFRLRNRGSTWAEVTAEHNRVTGSNNPVSTLQNRYHGIKRVLGNPPGTVPEHERNIPARVRGYVVDHTGIHMRNRAANQEGSANQEGPANQGDPSNEAEDEGAGNMDETTDNG